MVMCAVPAKVAGVKRIVAISPPLRDGTVDPLTLVAARICGVKEFYKIGGVQGISALAYGTPAIERVSKIVGPGGMFVTAAKFLASRKVSIDMSGRTYGITRLCRFNVGPKIDRVRFGFTGRAQL